MMKIESFGNGDQDERVSTTDWSIYHLMIVLALALTAGRISVVTSREGDTAFLSANDRSRWATVASLVERGTYEIDQQISITNPIHRNRRPWNSIDKVKHLGKDGKQHFYSSKPPLLATVVAAIYWAVYQVTGMTLTQQPLYVPRYVRVEWLCDHVAQPAHTSTRHCPSPNSLYPSGRSKLTPEHVKPRQ